MSRIDPRIAGPGPTEPRDADEARAVAAVRRAVRTALDALPEPLRAAPLLVACSGGADSTALLAAARAVAPGRVHVAVIDHGLQEGSAERSAALVADLTAQGVPAAVHGVVVDGGGGPEAAARRARYGALRIARPHPDSPVLLGHTLDDQAETVLLGLGRGSGARSLAGMQTWDPPWLRPLLGLRRADTAAACRAQGLAFWDDPHNVDPRFTRVRLRREVVPLLEEVLGGGVAEALARTAAQLHDDGEALDADAGDLLARAAIADHEAQLAGPVLDAAVLAVAPAAVRRRALRTWLGARGVTGLTDLHLRAADDLVGRWRGQGGVALPSRLELVREHGRLRVRTAAWPGARRGLAAGSVRRTSSTPPARTPGGPSVSDGDIASVLITEDQIREKTGELAAEVGKDYADRCSPPNDLLLVGVLKGAVMFMTDIARALPVPVQLEFMAVSSYGSATSSSGVVRILKDLDRDIAGRHVLIIEDIIDSGLTLSWLRRNLESRQPASLEVCTLLRKPDAITVDVPVRYVGFDIPNEFVVGYGLDYAERYRDLPFIGTLDPAVYS